MVVSILQLIRAPAGLTAVSNVLAAAIIASQATIDFSLLWLVAASCCFYYGGMVLNDCFDYREDRVERPERPLPRGELSLTLAWGMGFGLLALGLILAWCFSATSALIAVALTAAIVLYNGFIKQGIAGSICMAGCRYLNWLLGASFIAISRESYVIALPILFYIAGLTFLSKQETHARDKSAVFVTAALLLATAVTMGYLIERVWQLATVESMVAYALLALWALAMLHQLRRVFNEFTPATIQRLIGFMVIGVIPLDALLIALSGHYLWAIAVLALLPLCRWLNKYLYVT